MSIQNMRDNVDSEQLFKLLEGDNPSAVEEIKQVIHENLRADIKDNWLVNALVDRQLETGSVRCLDILSGIREQHKHLFDKLNDCLKSNSRRSATLSLVGDIIRKHPAWLHKIVHHPVMSTFLKVVKYEKNIIDLCNSLLILVTLLPMVPSLMGQHLPDIFEIFCRVNIFQSRSGNIPEIYMLHLKVAAQELFALLYGMYPNSFIDYLRNFINYQKEQRHSAIESLKPLLNQVRMHPLLVVTTKGYESSNERWKKYEPHDVLVECAKYNAGPMDNMAREDNTYNTSALQSLNLAAMVATNSVDSLLNSQNALNNQTASSVAENVVLAATSASYRRNVWNSGTLGDLSTPPQTPNTLSNSLNELNSSVADHSALSSLGSPTLEIGVEALANVDAAANKSVMVMDAANPRPSSKEASKQSTPDCSVPTTPQPNENVFRFPSSSSESSAIQRSPYFDRRRSPKKFVTTPPCVKYANKLDGESKGADTPNTTLTSTDQSNYNPLTSSMLSSPDYSKNYSPKQFDDDCSVEDSGAGPCLTSFEDSIKKIATTDGQSQAKIKNSMNRLRFMSQCMSTSSTPPAARMRRQISCPEFLSRAQGSDVSAIQRPRTYSIDSEKRGRKYSLPTTPVNIRSIRTIESTTSATRAHYSFLWQQSQQLVSDTANSVQTTNIQPGARSHPSCSFQSDSSDIQTPSAILNNYLQLGDSYFNLVPLTSSKFVKWTHFGGKAPADEVSIIRGQNQLLHYQLLFERHRQEVHAQRNRRLLRKCKTLKDLEEQNMAMRDQLKLQEKEIMLWKDQSNDFRKKIEMHESDNNANYNSVFNKIREYSKKIDNLEFSNGKLKELLVSQTDENKQLKNDLKKLNGSYFNIEKELGVTKELVSKNSSLKAQIGTLNKELVLMGELHQRYREKYAQSPSYKSESCMEMNAKQRYDNSIQDLMQQMKEIEIQMKAEATRSTQLQKELNNKDAVIAEQKLLLERTNVSNNQKILAMDNKYKAMRNMSQQLQRHILELTNQLELLSNDRSQQCISAEGAEAADTTCPQAQLQAAQSESSNQNCSTDS